MVWIHLVLIQYYSTVHYYQGWRLLDVNSSGFHTILLLILLSLISLLQGI